MKKNLWPLGIVAALLLFTLGTVALIAVAQANKVDLVSADYYEQEIRHQEQMDRVHRTRQLAAEANVSYDAARRSITVILPAAHVNQALKGRIHLYRPSAAQLDHELKLTPDAHGVQLVDAAALKAGLWRIRVSWTAGDREYFVEQKIVINRGTS